MDIKIGCRLGVKFHSNNKKDVLKQISHMIVKFMGDYHLEDDIYKSLLKREEEDTTGFGDGFAIPHGKISGINYPIVYFIRSDSYIDWNSLDSEAVNKFIVLIVPDSENNTHLRLLSTLSYHLMEPDFKLALENENDSKAIIDIIKDKMNEDI